MSQKTAGRQLGSQLLYESWSRRSVSDLVAWDYGRGGLMEFIRRIGPDPHLDESGGPTDTPNAGGCPDIWEIESGDIVVIGRRITQDVRGLLPDGVSCGPDEEVIVFPRGQLARASEAISTLR